MGQVQSLFLAVTVESGDRGPKLAHHKVRSTRQMFQVEKKFGLEL